MKRKQLIMGGFLFGVFVVGLVVAVMWRQLGESARCSHCWRQKVGRGLQAMWPSAPPRYISHPIACKMNLMALQAAKVSWASDHKKSDSDTPTMNDLTGLPAYVQEVPRCLHEGTYTLRSVAEKPTCSHPGHTL